MQRQCFVVYPRFTGIMMDGACLQNKQQKIEKMPVMYMFKWFMVALLHAERCLVFSVPPLSAVVMSCLGVWIPPGCC